MNVLSPVKSQMCGDCWANAGATVYEAAVAISRGTGPVEASVQEFINCAFTRNGCMGGSAQAAWKLANKFGGSLKKE